MGDVVNLRRARKAKARQATTVEAAANRALHGRTKQARQQDEIEHQRRETRLDGAIIDRADRQE